VQEENRKGMTILFSSHILAEVQMLCRRVAIIREGKIIRLEDIATLRKKQLKKVNVEFSSALKAGEFQLPGMVNPEASGANSLRFMYSGDINELVSSLSGKNIINLGIEEPSLEEIFMHFYK
jgi:ABC-2 type transport system ATP-binding protein